MALTEVGSPGLATAGSASGTATMASVWGTGQTQSAGDYLVALVFAGGYTSVGAITETSGTWTLLDSVTTTRFSVAVFGKVATGGDAAPTFNATFAGTAARCTWGIETHQFTGQDSTAPVPTTGHNSGTSATSIAVTTSGNVPQSGCIALSVAGEYYTTSSTKTVTVSSGWSLTNNWNSGASGYAHAGFAKDSTPASGSTLACTTSWGTGTTSNAAGVVVVIQPASPNVTVTPSTLAATSSIPAPTVTPVPVVASYDSVGPSSAGSSTTTGNTLSWTHTTVASAVGIAVGVAVGANPDTMTLTVTCDGVAMTPGAIVHANNATAGYVQKFTTANPVAAGAHTISVTASATPTSLAGGSIGIANAVRWGTEAHAAGSSATASTSVSTTASTNMVVSFVATGSGVSSATSPLTSRWINNASSSSGAGNGAGGTAVATGGSVTTSWAVTSDYWGVVSFEAIGGGTDASVSPAVINAVAAVQVGGASTPDASVNAGTVSATVSIPTPTVSVTPPCVNALASTTGASHFVDSAGNPKLLIVENPWALPSNAGRYDATYQATYDNYLTTRASQGFTGIYVTPYSNTGDHNTPYTDGRTWDGIYPFASGSTNDPSSGLNDTFWQRIDYMLTKAQALGLTILMNIGYAGGSEDMDSGGCLYNKTTQQYTDYGTNLANRYKNQPNIIWVVGNDYFGNYDSSYTTILSALRTAGDNHLISIHNMAESTSRFDLGNSSALAWGSSNAQFNFVYSYDCMYLGVEYAYAEASPLTVHWGDGYFYAGGSTYDASLDRAARQEFWWALSSGARGGNMGDEGIWQWPSGAQAQAANGWFWKNNIGNIRTFVESLPGWYNLTPATGTTLITAGRGTRATQYASGGNGGQYEPSTTNSYVGASRVSDGSLALLYLPNATTITIDQTKLQTGYTATWVDPITTATYPATVGSTYNSGAVDGTKPVSNSQGQSDWVLVFQAPVSQSATVTPASVNATTSIPAPAVSTTSGSATPAFVQNVGTNIDNTGTNATLTVTLAAGITTTAGNTLIASSKSLNGAALTGVTDSKGNTWIVDVAGEASSYCAQVSHAYLTNALVAGDTITFTWALAEKTNAAIFEFSGVASSSATDQTAHNQALTSTTDTVATTTATSVTNELVFVTAGCSGASNTLTVTASDPDSGGTWTALNYPSNVAFDACYQVLSGTSLTSCTWTSSASANMDLAMATFKPAAGGGTGATVNPSTVACTSSIPAPTVSGAQNAAVTPSTIKAITFFGSGLPTWKKLVQPTGGGTMNVCDIAPDGRIIGGADTQGYFLTSDNGDHWQVCNAGVGVGEGVAMVSGSFYMQSAAIAWSTTETNTIYSCTGEMGANGGFLASTDGGQTWTVRTTNVQFAGNHGNTPLPGAYPRSTGRLIAQDGTYVYVGTYASGVARSAASGGAGNDGFPVTATMAGSAPGTNNYYCRALFWDSASSTLWGGFYETGTTNGGLWKCTNPTAATPNFTRVTGTPSIIEDICVIGGMLYAACDTGGIYQYDIATATWTDITGSLSKSSNWDSLDAVVDGTNHLVAVTCSNPAAGSSGYINFAKLTIASNGTGGVTYQTLLQSNVNTSTLPPDNQAAAVFGLTLGSSGGKNYNVKFDPNDATHQKIYCPGSTGMYRSYDGGVTWTHAMNGYAGFHVLDVTVDPNPANPSRIIFGTTDYGTMEVVDGVGYNATDVVETTFSAPHGRYYVYDPIDYTVYSGWSDKNAVTGGEVAQKAETATSWTSMSLGTHIGSNAVSGLLTFRDASNNKVLLAAAMTQGVWRWTSAGGWVKSTGTLMTGSNQVVLTIMAYAGNGVCYIFDRDQGVLRSTDYGQSWSLIWSGTGATYSTGYVAVNPAVAGEIWVSADSGLYRISGADGASPSATKITASAVASNGPVKVDSNGTVFCATQDTGTGQGIYKSLDGGTTWIDLDPNNVFATQSRNPYQLDIDSTGRLYIGGSNILSVGYNIPATVTTTSSTGASVSAPVIAATSSIPTPSITAVSNATATPAAIAATSAIPTPSISAGGGATVSPAVVSAAATIPAPSITAVFNAAVTPQAISGIAVIPLPTESTSSTATPLVLSATAAIPTPTITAISNVSITPATVAATASIPVPSVSAGGGASIAPTVVSATTAIPTPGIIAGSTVSPASIGATSSVPTPGVVKGGTATPATVAARASIPAPTVTAITSQNITPAVINAAASIPTPSVFSAGNATAAPSVIAASASIPSPSVNTGGTVTPLSINATTNIYSISFTSSAAVAPSAVSGRVGIPTPNLLINTNVLASTVTASSAVPTPSVATQGNVTVSPSTVAASVAIPAPAVSTGTGVTPSTVNAVSAIPVPSISIGTTAGPGAVSASTQIPTPSVLTGSSASIHPSTAAAAAAIPVPSASGAASATVQPAVVVVSVSIPGPAASGSSTVYPSAVNSSAGIRTPQFNSQVDVQPAPVMASASIPAPSITHVVQASVQPRVLTVAATIPQPIASESAAIQPVSISAQATIPVPVGTVVALVLPDAINAVTTFPAPTMFNTFGVSTTRTFMGGSSTVSSGGIESSVSGKETGDSEISGRGS